MYKHGIEVKENSTSSFRPSTSVNAVQVVFGTVPVNLASDPYGITNKPIKVSGMDEAKRILGYSEDWGNYTLCASMYACFELFKVYPVIFINVLDPKSHKKTNVKKPYEVTLHQITLEETGILRDTIMVYPEADGEAYVENTDYIINFDEGGKIIITLLSTGSAYQAKKVLVQSDSIAPEMVDEADLIGSRNFETGEETGLEIVRQIYPKFKVVPSILLAPGWTEKPNVGTALMNKCEGINASFHAECLLDLDTTKTKTYLECGAVKAQMGYSDEHAIVLWPKLFVNNHAIPYSAVYGALMEYQTSSNGDIPYIYPSSKSLQVSGAVLASGTEVFLDQSQASVVNGEGIVTVLNGKDWVSYGNNMSCYPENEDPKDRWIACRRMFSYVSNDFIVTYMDKLDSPMDRRIIDDIINTFNIKGNSLKANGMCAGLSAEFRDEDNSDEDIINGHLTVRIKFAPFTPAEFIQAIAEFDVESLKQALTIE